ncbi:hypothetical protein [Campylobacter helveticus]|uniref:hypothetical protein n=1 Tax=Campylobacter helveticus TaxID=28898 RepID=UPI00104EBC4F|nr:hypothetical protein [Campylobacter helveticus]QBL11585.1 hypothetical protein A0073_03380 [Campylobacter helveticus]
MSETYEIILQNALILKVEKGSNKIIFEKMSKETGRYTQRYSKALFEAARLTKVYKESYQPIYLDHTLHTGQSSTLLEFKAWQELYLKDPPKGKIAPWTKKEKAYYESLKTKRERYKYLVIRSGLRPAILDVPLDAIAGVDDNGKVINPEYEEFFYLANLNSNRFAAYYSQYLELNEWDLLRGFLGDRRAFMKMSSTGWTARNHQALFLQAQLGDEDAFRNLAYVILCSLALMDGLHWNKQRAQMIYELNKNHKALLDKFGMIPYLDELIGVEWVIDFNTMYGWAWDPQNQGPIVRLFDLVDAGKLKDPRDKDSTPESRKEFDETSRSKIYKFITNFDFDIPNEWSEADARERIENKLLLPAKILALTPHQGYPNAPTYYTPEYLEELYKNGELDKKLNPTIPAIYRDNFPEYLRQEIEAYAKRHHIKD